MQRYFVKSKKDNNFILEKDDIHHIKNVMRNKENDVVECIYENTLYHGKIKNVENGIIEIIDKADENHEMKRNITIAISLVKEQKMDLILQKLTELGISQIIPLKTERSIIKLDEKKQDKKLDRWIKIVKEASEQSKRNKIPTIMPPISLKELVNIDFDKKYTCSTKKCQKLNASYLQEEEKCATIVFVIGPEGGLSPKEELFLEENGYQSVSFGSRIMRVETAAIYIASIMNFIE